MWCFPQTNTFNLLSARLVSKDASINKARPVKLLNGTQNVWASNLSDRKIWIKLE
jgi:hypothetical protein